MKAEQLNYAVRCESTANRCIAWNQIDWEKAEALVNRLQIRIVKAAQKGCWNLVKRLQHLLVNSFYAKLLAIKRVTTNRGKNTPGIDGRLWKTSKDKAKAVEELNNIGYRAQPLKRVYIEKFGKKEKRPLSIPTMKDRAMQALHLQAIAPIAETTTDRTSSGFRLYRSPHDAMQYTFLMLGRKTAPQWILEGDIKGCFDNISHEWLMNNIPMNKSILQKFLKAGYSYQRKLFPTNSGAAQGGIISPTLANMTLDGMEQALEEVFRKKDKRRPNERQIHFIRFADDFIVTAKDKETAEEAKTIIQSFLIERGLTLSDNKTTITHIRDGFEFLGWEFRKYKDGKLIIRPSHKSIQKCKMNIRKTFEECKSSSQRELIRRLNQIIIGWANYHQPVCAKKAYSSMDYYISLKTWKWAKRRHPKKKNEWLRERYWKSIGNRNYVFETQTSRLKRASDTPIVRHTLTKMDKNPFTEAAYFKDKQAKEKKKRKQAYLKSAAAQLSKVGL